MSYSPITGLVYFTVQEDWVALSVAREFTPRRFRSNPAWGFEPNAERRAELSRQAAERRQAWLTAWDPVRQREVWRVPHSNVGSGGTLATAGNLVFQGSIDKEFVAYRADNGERLWGMDIQTVALAGPVSFEVDGEQYIAVNAGWGGGRAIVSRAMGENITVSPARLLVFKPGGTAQLPTMADLTTVMPPQPPPLTANEETVQLGARLFTETCQQCHGQNAIGGLKDLRYMTPEAHRDFNTTVLEGTLEEKGMAAFADILDAAQVNAIHAYIIARANESWGNDLSQPGETE
jgi:quinohemoprotein ethanol dehydrogenase